MGATSNPLFTGTECNQKSGQIELGLKNWCQVSWFEPISELFK
jgi:hypothetical protein